MHEMNTKHAYLPTRTTPTLAPFRFTIAPSPLQGAIQTIFPRKRKAPMETATGAEAAGPPRQ